MVMMMNVDGDDDDDDDDNSVTPERDDVTFDVQPLPRRTKRCFFTTKMNAKHFSVFIWVLQSYHSLARISHRD